MWNSGTSSDTLTYGYTNNNQLTSVTHTDNAFANETFSWDANGNQTGSGYTTGTGNEQTASPGYTYTYDADGNMLAATQTSTGDVWTYTYDFRNLMASAVEKNSSGTILAQATFTYDALGNRTGMNENGVQTWTLYDGSTPVMDFTSTGSLATRYLNGPAGDLVDTVLARELSNGAVAWYLADRLGTVRDVINNTGGIIDHVDYSAFGSVLNELSPSNGDRMTGFAGLERDTVTGLNLAVFRVQSPNTGRWTSQDPLAFRGGDADLYRYIRNDPVGFVDRYGLQDPSYGILPLPVPQILIQQVPPTKPVGTWSPEQFFGVGSPLIYQTAWGCGALAAWRAGVRLGPGQTYHPSDILKIPGVREYTTGRGALARVKELGGRGLIIVVQHPSENWKGPWAGGNYATYWGTHWEYCNHGEAVGDPSHPREIYHSKTLPNMDVRTIIVVPVNYQPVNN